MTRICIRCKEEKNLDLFCYSKKNKDGRKNVCKKCHTNYMTEYYKNNPEKLLVQRKNAQYRPNWFRHHITRDEYLDLLSLYKGKCHACKTKDAVNIDHDHSCCPGSFSCGRCIRGVLCSQCNTSLGLMGDSKDRLLSLIDYISKN